MHGGAHSRYGLEVGLLPVVGGTLCRITVPCHDEIVGGEGMLCGFEAVGHDEASAIVGALRLVRRARGRGKKKKGRRIRAKSRARVGLAGLDAVFLFGKPARKVTAQMEKLARRVEKQAAAAVGAPQAQMALDAALQAAPHLKAIAMALAGQGAKEALGAVMAQMDRKALQAAASLPSPYGPAMAIVGPIVLPKAKKILKAAAGAAAAGGGKWVAKGASSAAAGVRKAAGGVTSLAKKAKFW